MRITQKLTHDYLCSQMVCSPTNRPRILIVYTSFSRLHQLFEEMFCLGFRRKCNAKHPYELQSVRVSISVDVVVMQSIFHLSYD